MGISWSSNRRRNQNNNPNPHAAHAHRPSQLIASSSAPSSSSYPYIIEPYPTHPPPHPPGTPIPPPPQPPLYNPYAYSGGYGASNYPNSTVGRANFGPYYSNQSSGGWGGFRPSLPLPPLPPPPPPYVDHQQAKKIKNDVNVQKNTLRLEIDELNPDHHLVSFVFDALFDGSFTIFYTAKEEPNCKFVPLYPDAYMPVKVPFQKGVRQNFRQPSGTGIDLGFFDLDELSKPSTAEDVFPLVISAEVCLPSASTKECVDDPSPSSSPHNMQITQAVIQKNDESDFQVKVIRQILWVDEVRYELREIYGIGNSAAETFKDDDGKECVICLTEPKDTAVLPCRHMCMCSDCSKLFTLHSDKCPICRQPIDELIEIKINKADQ